jgi:hypothetical protein
MVFKRGGGRNAEVLNGCGPSCKDLLDKVLGEAPILDAQPKPEFELQQGQADQVAEANS